MRPTHEKKLRSDSKFARLTDAQRDELASLLLSGTASQSDALQWLGERGVTVSAQSLSEYYRNRVLPVKWRTFAASAETLNRISAAASAEAAHKAIAQTVFELSTAPSTDPKELAQLYKLMLDGIAAVQNDRKIKILEAKARQAERARAALEKKVSAGGLSPEALALAEEQLALL